MRPPSAESITRLITVAQTGSRLNVFTGDFQQTDVDGSFSYYGLRSRTSIRFESQLDHPQHAKGFFFYSFVSTLYLKKFLTPDFLIFHCCTSSPDRHSICYKQRNFGSFVWHFYITLRIYRFNLRTEAYLTLCIYFLWVFCFHEIVNWNVNNGIR
jgi:hypothetical protein